MQRSIKCHSVLQYPFLLWTALTLPTAAFLAQLIPNTVRNKTLTGDQIYLIERQKFIKWGETWPSIWVHVFSSRLSVWRLILYVPYNTYFSFHPKSATE